MPAEVQPEFSVGPWLVRPQLNSLVRESRSCHVTPKSMEVLLALAKRDGDVVTKEDLLQEIWPDTFVSDDALTRCIGELRRAFEDTARAPKVIGTVTKRGYRLLQPVVWSSGATQERPALVSESVGRSSRRAVFAAGVLLALSAFIMTRGGVRPAPHGAKGSAPQRIVVLPLLNLSGDPEQEYLAEGMTEEIISRLARMHSWDVISRTSAMHYKGTRLTIGEIARELSVDGVVEGSVLRSGNRVRVTAQFVDARNDVHLWAGSFERELADVLSLQAEIAGAIGAELNLTLHAPPAARVPRIRSVIPEAYEAYLKGLHFFSNAEYAKAAGYFERATITDPQFALAHAYLYESDGMAAFSRDAPPGERALRAMRTALALDDGLAEAHTNLGDFKFYWQWDWKGGESEFQHAVELDPSSVDSALHYATCLHVLGRWEAALQQCRRALRLDPVSYRMNLMMLSLLTDTHRWQEALEQYQRTMELDPKDAGAARYGGLLYEALGRQGDAVRAYLEGNRARRLADADLRRLEEAAAAGGLRGYWLERLRQLRARSGQVRVSPVLFAYVYTRLGDADAAIESLEQAYRERAPNLAWLKARAYWDPLRSDRRFQRLLERMRFPQ